MFRLLKEIFPLHLKELIPFFYLQLIKLNLISDLLVNKGKLYVQSRIQRGFNKKKLQGTFRE